MSALVQAPADFFYFNRAEHRLFGVLHEAQTYAQRERGVVICYPFGNEYIRSHRACRHLALALSEAGFPVLRFDYSGTGDSTGDGEVARLDDWRADTVRAVEELRQRTGVETICLAGLRLGASLALEVGTDRYDVDSLILWEPIVNGRDYLAEMARQHSEHLWRYFDDDATPASVGIDEFMGFPVGTGLRGDLEALDLLAIPAARVPESLITESGEDPGIAHLREAWINADCDPEYRQVPSFSVWREDVDKGLVPNDVIREIVNWAAEELP